MRGHGERGSRLQDYVGGESSGRTVFRESLMTFTAR